jgi:putative membrane protein
VVEARKCKIEARLQGEGSAALECGWRTIRFFSSAAVGTRGAVYPSVKSERRPLNSGDLMMKTIMMAASAAILLGGCAMTPAADMSSGAMAMTTDARTFMNMAHSSNMFEIEASRLALRSSRNQFVRSFAQMMVTDHTRLMQQMMPMHGQPSMRMMPQHMQMLERLRSAPAASFDRMYHQQMMMGHQQALNLRRTYAASGDVEALRAMAASAVPVIEMHLRELQTHGAHMMGS